MLRDSFYFLRRNINIYDNSNIKQKVVRGYDPLLKVRNLPEIIMKGMRGIWTAGKHVIIDEIIIKYMGRDFTYVQYMPVNLINHGIKEFAICCALSEILLGFKVYVGHEDNSDNTDLGICDDLVKETGINSVIGCMVYTIKYYTYMALPKDMFTKYGCKIVGDIIPTDKKSRAANYITFLKL